MLIRIRWRRSSVRSRQEMALALAALLTPAALVAFTICFWSFAAELQWTNGFFVNSGLFSHWQVWLILAAGQLACARLLISYSQSGTELKMESHSNFHSY